jgi:non-specific serine/threonine protein kinase/serine/threonine-protein kinase
MKSNPQSAVWKRAQEIFFAALTETPEDREAVARRLCDGDEELWAMAARLLAGHADPDRLLVTPSTVMDPAEREDDPSLPCMIGAYRLLEKIGAGGMGAVYRAERADGQFRKQVAVKLMAGSALRPSAIQRFVNERQILANLDHPNIARLLDGGVDGEGRPYIVMEYVDGIAIDRYCRERVLAAEEIVRLFEKVCAAVEYAHGNAVVHRDLKPGNLLVTQDGTPKLLDFGISKLLDGVGEDAAPIEHSRGLTPDYASPEQLRGQPPSPANDVYSLGVLLYELLTGERPQSRGPASAREKAGRRVSRDLDAIVMKAMAPEASARYGSAGELREDLRRLLLSRTVAARPQAIVARMLHFLERHRWQAAGAATAAIALAGGVVLAREQARRSAEHRLETVRVIQSLFSATDRGMSRLPESAEARRLFVQEVEQRLDGLEREAGNDPELLYQIAFAYQQLARSQGWAPDSVGDFRGAMQSFQRALPLALRANRANRPKADRLTASLYQGLAGTANWVGDYAMAYRTATEGQSFLKQYRIHVATADDKEYLAYNLLLLGSYRGESLVALGRMDEARAAWREAEEAAAPYEAQRPRAYQLVGAIITLKQDIGEHYCALGDSSAGMLYGRSAERWARIYAEMSGADASPNIARQVEAVIGQCELAAHHGAAALAIFERLATSFSAESKRDPRNSLIMIRLLYCKRDAARARLETGDLDGAASAYQEAQVLLRSVPDSETGPTALNNTGQILAGLAQVEMKRSAQSPAGSEAGLRHLRSGCDSYRKAAAALQKQLQSGGLWLGSRLALQQAEAALPGCADLQ